MSVIPPNIYVDLVIYRDNELMSPYFVFECKRADVSDAAFNQSIEQACGYRASLGAKYCGAVAGLTRRLLRFDRFPPGERDRNHLTDIPISYGTRPRGAFTRRSPGRTSPPSPAKSSAPPYASATRPCGKEDAEAPSWRSESSPSSYS